MKKTIAALILAAAVTTPAMAAGYRQGGAITPDPGLTYNDQFKASQAYAYQPAMTGVVWESGMYAGADPDPSVRLQLQINADTIYNR